MAAVWGRDDQPANAAKALQVVVSRTRSQLGSQVVERTEAGYRLGLAARTWMHSSSGSCVREAARAEAVGDLMLAAEQARRALAVAVDADAAAPAALEELRAHACDDQTIARGVLGRAASGLGDHPEALTLLAALADPDEATLAALLRSEAAVHGAPTALARYERHRSEVRDRLGVDPGPVLQAVHAELLAADNPVRTGLRLRRDVPGRARRRRTPAPGAGARVAGHLDPRPRWPGQDQAGAAVWAARPSSPSCTSSSWSAWSRPRTSSARSGRRSACATRSAGARCCRPSSSPTYAGGSPNSSTRRPPC